MDSGKKTEKQTEAMRMRKKDKASRFKATELEIIITQIVRAGKGKEEMDR